jgi:putative endonuclease
MKDWFVYMVECSDGSLYTGITNDVEKRLAAHNAGKGAKYTKGRGPVILKYLEKLSSKGKALKREIEIKKMSREEKQKLSKD